MSTDFQDTIRQAVQHLRVGGPHYATLSPYAIEHLANLLEDLAGRDEFPSAVWLSEAILGVPAVTP